MQKNKKNENRKLLFAIMLVAIFNQLNGAEFVLPICDASTPLLSTSRAQSYDLPQQENQGKGILVRLRNFSQSKSGNALLYVYSSEGRESEIEEKLSSIKWSFHLDGQRNRDDYGYLFGCLLRPDCASMRVALLHDNSIACARMCRKKPHRLGGGPKGNVVSSGTTKRNAVVLGGNNPFRKGRIVIDRDEWLKTPASPATLFTMLKMERSVDLIPKFQIPYIEQEIILGDSDASESDTDDDSLSMIEPMPFSVIDPLPIRAIVGTYSADPAALSYMIEEIKKTPNFCHECIPHALVTCLKKTLTAGILLRLIYDADITTFEAYRGGLWRVKITKH